MKRLQITDQKLEKSVDILDQAALALKFYAGTKNEKYWQEFCWAVKRLELITDQYTKIADNIKEKS